MTTQGVLETMPIDSNNNNVLDGDEIIAALRKSLPAQVPGRPDLAAISGFMQTVLGDASAYNIQTAMHHLRFRAEMSTEQKAELMTNTVGAVLSNLRVELLADAARLSRNLDDLSADEKRLLGEVAQALRTFTRVDIRPQHVATIEALSPLGQRPQLSFQDAPPPRR